VRFAAPVAIVLSLLGAGGCTSAPELSAATPPSRLDSHLVARGAELAAVGDCRGCHTRHGGQAYTGGLPMRSPFGTVYTTNITPDPETGVGRWSQAAFRRAMREGIRIDGAHLYPAFPYDRFTRTSDEDIAALYAYLMSLQPVRYVPPANQLVFPFNIRAGIALWKHLYFKNSPSPLGEGRGEGRADGRGADRGEYLVEGLGHCGSCHSPRTPLYGEDLAHAYDGGEAEGWHAYAINEKNTAPIPWDAPALAFYLRHGYHPRHGISRGTMGIVTHELADASQADLDAMAAYVVKLMKPPSAVRLARANELQQAGNLRRRSSREPGAVIYQTACRDCHDGDRELPWGGLPLVLSTALSGENPRNLINVIFHGLPPDEGETTPMMPGYAGALDDAQVEALVTWMRANLSDQPPWKGVPAVITAAKGMSADMLLFPPGGAGTKPEERAR